VDVAGLGRPDPGLATMRQEYMAEGLDAADLSADPVAQFEAWLADVVAAGLPEPNAMVVSTVGPGGVPSARMTLLKSVDARGFVFFTNYTSRKATELAANPAVCLLFPWHALRRQVIVSGTASRLPAEESAAYFHSRPHSSQLGAWASRQSAVLGDRAELDGRFAALAERWPAEVPAPDFWGGFVVAPYAVEFWQGRASRLHDRLRYALEPAGGAWTVARLAP
jgi:pyridoxamine 5'-phosphate oxidase